MSRKPRRVLVAVSFVLDEDVTPELFVRRVALACADRGALRIGEQVLYDLGRGYEIIEETAEPQSKIAGWLIQPTGRSIRPIKTNTREVYNLMVPPRYVASSKRKQRNQVERAKRAAKAFQAARKK